MIFRLMLVTNLLSHVCYNDNLFFLFLLGESEDSEHSEAITYH